jgi:hypothetical protein
MFILYFGSAENSNEKSGRISGPISIRCVSNNQSINLTVAEKIRERSYRKIRNLYTMVTGTDIGFLIADISYIAHISST